MKRFSLSVILWMVVSSIGSAQEADPVFQTPSITKPREASLAGALANFDRNLLGTAGGLPPLVLPLQFPEARGPLFMDLRPSYSPTEGLGPWGLGWRQKIQIERTARVGEPSFRDSDDLFVSPWGTFQRGVNNQYYLESEQGLIKAKLSEGDWTVYDPSGKIFTFNSDDALASERGISIWNLTRIESQKSDDVTRFTYEKVGDAMPWLKTITYGGPEDSPSYLIDFHYIASGLPFFSYRSGAKVAVNRLVKELKVSVRSGASYSLRWTYTFDYSQKANSLGYFLEKVEKSYPTGNKEPPIRLAYYEPSFLEQNLNLEPNASVQSAISSFGRNVLNSRTASFVDFNDDGLLDLDDAVAKTRYIQSHNGWLAQAYDTLPGYQANPQKHPSCQASVTSAQNWSRIGGFGDPNFYRVNVFNLNGIGTIVVCNVLEELVYEQRLDIPGSLGGRGKWADLNSDGREEFIDLNRDITIMENLSRPDSFRFQKKTLSLDQGARLLMANLQSFAIVDLNGDGLQDLIGISSNGIQVLYGKGQLDFERSFRFIPFTQPDGSKTFRSTGYKLNFGDLNRDGLSDLILSNATSFLFMINLGEELRYKPTRIQNAVSIRGAIPLLINLSGGGYQQVSFNAGNTGFYSINLNAEDSGLLRSIDDGKGNIVQLRYGRQRSIAQGGRGLLTLEQADLQTTGLPAYQLSFEYRSPVRSIYKPSTLGYGQVVRRMGPTQSLQSFRLEDERPPLLIESRGSDERVPNWIEQQVFAYEPAVYEGFTFRRKTNFRKTWLNRGRQIGSDVQETYAYLETPYCQSLIEKRTMHGLLRKSVDRWEQVAWNDHLHCLVQESRTEARHADKPQFDTVERRRFVMNQASLVESVAVETDAGWQTEIEMSYYDSGRLKTWRKAGMGSFRVDYDQNRLLESITNPLEHTDSVDYEDFRDLVQSVKTMRDRNGQKFEEVFAYDSFDRLVSTWNTVSLGQTSEPLFDLEYQWADSQTLASIRKQELTTEGQLQLEQQLKLLTGNGLERLTAKQEGESLRVSSLHEYDPMLNRTSSFTPQVIDGTLDSLKDQIDRLERTLLKASTESSLGFTLETEVRWQADQIGQKRSSWVDANGVREFLHVENNRTTSRQTLDPEGRILSFQDESGRTWTFSYDARGRLRSTRLPGGMQLSTQYDALGRISQLAATGMGEIRIIYLGASELVDYEHFLDQSGNLVRVQDYEYDQLGRLKRKSHSHGPKTRTFDYFYDGESADGNVRPGQVGFLSEVKSNQMRKSASFNLDGTLRMERLAYGSHLAIEQSYVYYPNALVKSREVKGQYKARNHSYRLEQTYDSQNRLKVLRLNNRPIATIDYTPLGQIETMTLASGSVLTMIYDPKTAQMQGYGRQGRTSEQFSFVLNNRGWTERETYGEQSKQYFYTDNGWLERVGGQTSAYTYTVAGLPDKKLGPDEVLYDQLGRMKRFRDLELSYGADGRLESARRGASISSYDYDENFQRVYAKFQEREILSVGSVYLTEQGLIEPVFVGGIAIGIIKQGNFEEIFADNRGTILRDTRGNSSWPEPFGLRDGEVADSEILDYVKKRRDPVTRFVEMGVRDYSPELGKFVTPDEYFVRGQELCLSSPVECNLYSYARNNPLKYVDPSGKNTVVLGGAGPESETVKYAPVLASKFEQAGVVKPEYVPISISGKEMNIARTLAYRDTPFEMSAYNVVKSEALDFMKVQERIFHASNSDGGQRNIVGYSYGSVMGAQAALRMANMGIKVDNVALIGSPISSDSDLYKALTTNPNIANVVRFDIEGDNLSGGIGITPMDAKDLVLGDHRHFQYINNSQGQQDQLAREISGSFNGN